MNQDIHQWLNRKRNDKVAVRVCIGAETHAHRHSTADDSGNSDVGKPSSPMLEAVAKEEGVVRRPLARAERNSGKEQAAAAVEVPAERAGGTPAARWKYSPIFSGLVIVIGAAMVGLLMGWTVWTLLVPVSSG